MLRRLPSVIAGAAVLAALIFFGRYAFNAPLATSDAGGEDHPRRAEVIAYAKALDVHRLDPALPSERLDRFLTRLLPKDQQVQWASSDCENKPPAFPRPPNTPLCASVHASALGGALRFELVVGTHANAINGTPRIEKLYILRKPNQPIQTFKSLSEFASACHRGG